MYILIDHYDSFVYNLAAYLKEDGQEVLVKRSGKISLSQIREAHPEGILLSPGPRTPKDAAFSQTIIHTFQGSIPILGICLGHQIIAHCFGGKVQKGTTPVHGKVTPIYHNKTGLFTNLPSPFSVTRYHSLAVQEKSLPQCLSVDARTSEGVVMAISHRTMPIYGVQYHPEAVLTEYGHQLLKNFCGICREWRERHAYHQGA